MTLTFHHQNHGQLLGELLEIGLQFPHHLTFSYKHDSGVALERTRALTEILEVGRGLLSRPQQVELTRRVLLLLVRTALIKPRKKRSCQRALRQPVKSWPKMKSPTSSYPVVKIFITDANP